MSNFKVSQSKVSTWRRCRQAYHYANVENIAPKRKARPLKFGTIVHQMTEADIAGKNPFKVLSEVVKTEGKLFEAEREMYGDIEKDIGHVMRAYFDYWDKRPNPITYLPVGKKMSEHAFEVQLVDGITIKGKIDAFAQSKGKKMKWLVEHKSHKTFPKPDHRWRNLQSVIYIHVAELMGWFKLEGTIWDYIRSKPPTRPAILKSGEMSRAALDSLPQVVEEVIKQAKLKRGDYLDVIKQQEENQATWFQRVFTPVSKDIIKPVLNDFIDTAREMSELHGKAKQRTFGRHCEWCGYAKLCAAALQGHDEDFIKEREYEPNDYNAVEEETE